jgi:large subunit ribosomal protein L5
MRGENLNRLQAKYQQEIRPILKKEFKVSNSLAVPKVVKVVINVGVGEIFHDKGALEKAKETLMMITGQKPLVCPAKKAIADFKIRKGQPVGLKVTLRGKRMYQFLDKFFTLVLAQVRDFRGANRKAFDGQANYTFGLREQTIFPEVDYDKIDKVRGLEISLITSTKDKKKALRLLELLGMPFEKGGQNR